MLSGEDNRDMHVDPAEKTFKITPEPLMFFLLRFGSKFLVDIVLQKKAALARHNAGLAPPDEEDGTADSGSYEVLSSSTTTTAHVRSAEQFPTTSSRLPLRCVVKKQMHRPLLLLPVLRHTPLLLRCPLPPN